VFFMTAPSSLFSSFQLMTSPLWTSRYLEALLRLGPVPLELQPLSDFFPPQSRSSGHLFFSKPVCPLSFLFLPPPPANLDRRNLPVLEGKVKPSPGEGESCWCLCHAQYDPFPDATPTQGLLLPARYLAPGFIFLTVRTSIGD